MKLITCLLLLFTTNAFSQAIYDARGQYKGYSQTTSSGVTTIYDTQGRSLGSSQVDNGQTNYYSPGGAYQGTNTATPTHMQPNTTINTPRQPPQPPSVKGW
jgi:hypothetical protein